MYYSQQSFLVLGLSKSGQAAAEFLLERQARVYVYDDVSGDRIEQAFLQLTSKGGIRLTKSDLEKASEYLNIAATIIEIKARRLVPPVEDFDDYYEKINQMIINSKRGVYVCMYIKTCGIKFVICVF